MRLLLVLSFFSFAVQCLGLEVDKRGDELYLRDPSCNLLKKETQALANWTKSTGENKDCYIHPQNPFPKSKLCEQNITNCVPNHVDKYEGMNPKNSGPNCFNLALVMKDILPQMRYSTPEEMAFYMQPPLCRQLKNSEKRQPGDVGAIRSIQKGVAQESHGFIYISENLAYSKNGYYNASPYELQSLENVYNAYGVPNKKPCRQNELGMTLECPNAVSYFRCNSMEDYLKNHKDIPGQILSSLKNIGQFEQCLQEHEIKGSSLSGEARKNILDVTMALASYLDNESKTDKSLGMKNDEKTFLLGALQLRLDAICVQLGLEKDTTLYDLFPLSLEVKHAAASLSGQ